MSTTNPNMIPYYDANGNILGYFLQIDPPSTGNGAPGAAATIAVGSVATLDHTQSAVVQNAGTSNAAVLNFGIPAGAPGAAGSAGAPGPQGQQGAAGTLSNNGGVTTIASAVSASNVATNPAPPPTIINFVRSLFSGHGWTTNTAGSLWNTVQTFAVEMHNTLRGIKQIFAMSLENYGEGDVAGHYIYVSTVAPGIRTGADEGATALSLNLSESNSRFFAKIGSTTGTGDTGPTYSNSSQRAFPADGGTMVNTSKGAVAGTITAIATTLENYLMTVPITVSAGAVSGGLPLTTAWGYFPDNYNPTGLPTSQTVSRTFTLTLRQIAGVAQPFVVGMARLLGGTMPEMVAITAVGSVSAGTQSVTFNSRYGQKGGYLFQGGLAGQTLSLDENVAAMGKRTAHAVGGSIDGANLIYTCYFLSTARPLVIPMEGLEPATLAVSGKAGIHLYPSAEVVAILDYNNPPTTVLEANNVAWAVGDNVECCDPIFWSGSALRVGDYTTSPLTAYQGGNTVLIEAQNKSSAHEMLLVNHQYTYNNEQLGNGGGMMPPLGIVIRGTMGTSFTTQYTPAPQQSGALIDVRQLHPLNTTNQSYVYLNDNATGGQVSRQYISGNWYWKFDRLAADISALGNASASQLTMPAGSYLDSVGQLRIHSESFVQYEYGGPGSGQFQTCATEDIQVTTPTGTATLYFRKGLYVGHGTP